MTWRQYMQRDLQQHGGFSPLYECLVNYFQPDRLARRRRHSYVTSKVPTVYEIMKKIASVTDNEQRTIEC
jgi:hypothetical protein